MDEQTKQETKQTSSIPVRVGTDIITVCLSATLLVLPIEDGQYWIATFVAMVPLLLRMWNRTYWAIFILAFSTFFLYFFYSLQWIDAYGIHWRIFITFMQSLSYGFAFVLAFWIQRRYKSHFYATILATIFVLLDFKQTLGFMGFPWPILCHTQCSNLALIQIASFTGCWGVTFIVVNVNEALAHCIADGFKARTIAIGVIPILLVSASGLYGALSLAKPNTKADIQTTLVQWDRSTMVEWSQEFSESALDGYMSLTVDELKAIAPLTAQSESSVSSKIIIWPETSIPDALRRMSTFNIIQNLANAYDSTFLVGCMTWDPADSVPVDSSYLWRVREEYREYNSIAAFEPDGTVIPIYSKIRLVPFGEVIPMAKYITKWFPDYPWGSRDISPGTGYYVAETKTGKIGAVICYESFFPQTARDVVRNGADILVLVSNTSWFGRTRASYQHARFDVYRAVENGIWFARGATTGVCSVVDPHGKVVVETELFKPDAVTVNIGKRAGTTFYTRHGDWLPALCGIYMLMLLLGVFLIREDDVVE